jgi:hypothetical protein
MSVGIFCCPMKRRRLVLIVAGVAVAGVAVWEDAARRGAERRYRAAVDGRRQLEQRVGEMLATHDQVQVKLQQEQQRSGELSESLAAARGQLDEMTVRLSDEDANVKKLQARLASMQQQMDQVQGELALAMQERQQAAAANGSGPVQLERILVTGDAPSGLHGRVLSVYRDWDFVVINLGWDLVRVGDTVSIVRDGQLLAKARVERVQEDLCAATVLPEWDAASININDAVQIL